MSDLRIVIHDLSQDNLEQIDFPREKYLLISAEEKAGHCQGCFGCWLKSPGKCVYQDRLQYIGAVMAQSKEITVISQNCYGGYSHGIKQIIDRSIGVSLPLFTYRGGKIHHLNRYHNRPNFTVYMYGEMSDFEKQIASELVQANGINMGYQNIRCFFAETSSQLQGVLQ